MFTTRRGRAHTRVSAVFGCALALLACAPSADPAAAPEPQGATGLVEVASVQPGSSEPAPPAAAVPRVIPEGAPLEAGRVDFIGMLRPAKGGLDLRGILIPEETLTRDLGPKPPSTTQDGLLGAKLRVVAELTAIGGEADRTGPAVQLRSGPGFRLRELVSARVVAEPQLISGSVSRSKGLFSVGNYLVSKADLEWSLASPREDVLGRHVRLWGQPRTVVCPPDAQCLIGGSLPLFDVGRAEWIK